MLRLIHVCKGMAEAESAAGWAQRDLGDAVQVIDIKEALEVLEQPRQLQLDRLCLVLCSGCEHTPRAPHVWVHARFERTGVPSSSSSRWQRGRTRYRVLICVLGPMWQALTP
eukprot:3959973-Prymnesium_polylepis.2